jgi:hypothetical protein
MSIAPIITQFASKITILAGKIIGRSKLTC